jgi:hypothetical protein
MTISRYIAIEGGERSGKTTSLKTIIKAVKQATNLNVITFREPHYYRDVILALLEKFSSLLLCYLESKEFLQELLDINLKITNLLIKERERRLKETIWPALWNERNSIVITDRSIMSTWVYQYQLLLSILDPSEHSKLQPIYDKLINFCTTDNIPNKYVFMSGCKFYRTDDTSTIDTNERLNELIDSAYLRVLVDIPCFKNKVIRLNPLDLNVERPYFFFDSFSHELIQMLDIVPPI